MGQKCMQILLWMTLIGSMTGFVTILFRFLCKKLPKKWMVYLWLIVFFRLLCPVSIITPFSAFRLFEISKETLSVPEAETTASLPGNEELSASPQKTMNSADALTAAENAAAAIEDTSLSKVDSPAEYGHTETEDLTIYQEIKNESPEIHTQSEKPPAAALSAAAWFLQNNAYYGEKPVNRQRLNAMISILIMVFLCAGINAYEKQSGVVPMLWSTLYGRAKLLHRKLLMAGLAAVFVWLFVWIRELRQYISMYGTEILAAPVRNLLLFSEFPFNVTIRGYLMILYGMRLAMLIPVGWAVLCISYFAPNVRMSCLLGTAVLVLPALFTVLGASFFQWITPLIPVSAAELLLGLGQGKWWCVFAFAAWITAGHAALKVCINSM